MMPTPPPLSLEECQELETLMNAKYAHLRETRSFSVICRLEESLVSLEVVLANAQKSFYYPVTGQMVPDKDLPPKDAAFFLADMIDEYFSEYLEDQDVLLPIDFAVIEYLGHKFSLKGQILNLALEEKANALLKETARELSEWH